ncbi:MAG: DUF6754 domain-containing protein [candidate division WOR-3 bacterium]
MKFKISLFVIFILINVIPIFANNIEPPTKVIAKDAPNDAGGKIIINWQLSVSDQFLEGYKILRKVKDSSSVISKTIYFDFNSFDIQPSDVNMLSAIIQDLKITEDYKCLLEGYTCPIGNSDYNVALGLKRAKSVQNYFKRAGLDTSNISIISYGEKNLVTQDSLEYWRNRRVVLKIITSSITQVGFIGSGRNQFIDENTIDGVKYAYQILAVQDLESAASEWSDFVSSKQQWFHTERFNVVIFTLIFTFLIIYYINRAKKGANLFVRKIAGLLAVDEAVGRATEMGKPILYVPGLTGISDVATIAAMNILGEVAKKIATYDSQLIVPNTDPIVYTVAQEVVKEAYTQAGRPDAFKADSVYFVTDSQFAYAAAVDGIMTRERPATNFFMGYFYAEALILAETGASTGAVQIAGTDSVMQLPFFIVACDYTLMGEELYAASAYLSREPLLLGGLIGQDWGKAIIVGILIIATLIGLLTNLQVLNIF